MRCGRPFDFLLNATHARAERLSEEDAQRLADWREAFDPLIESVNAARRAVLANDPLDDDQLAHAVVLGREIEAAAPNVADTQTVNSG